MKHFDFYINLYTLQCQNEIFEKSEKLWKKIWKFFDFSIFFVEKTTFKIWGEKSASQIPLGSQVLFPTARNFSSLSIPPL